VGISGTPSGYRVLLALAAVVVAVGAVSLVVTGAGRTAPTPKPSASSGPTLIPLDCASGQLQLHGAYNECASIDTATRSCDDSMAELDDIFRLTTPAHHHYELYVDIQQFTGPGDYPLTEGALQVDFYDGNGAEWSSVAGSVTVITNDGRSGTVHAILEPWVGNTSALALSISGPWSCD
jgi:hypothetical protein